MSRRWVLVDVKLMLSDKAGEFTLLLYRSKRGRVRLQRLEGHWTREQIEGQSS